MISSSPSACPINVPNPTRILLVDDEAAARKRLRNLLEDCQSECPNIVAGEADNGKEALAKINQAPVDVALIDIRMPGMDGLTLARHLTRLPQPPAVIFVTAHNEHAISAFEIGAIDYLLKPVKSERLVEALKRSRRLSPQAEDTLAELTQPRREIVVQDRGQVWLVPVTDILYLRAELKYVTLRTREKEYVLNESLAKLEEEFSQHFLRIHRNCLVNRQHLSGFELNKENEDSHWVARLRDWPEPLPVSRRQSHVIKEFKTA